MILGVGDRGATSAAVSLSGYLLGLTVRSCALIADWGISNATFQERNYLRTAAFTIEENLLWCRKRGLNLERRPIHYGTTRCAHNLVLACKEVGISATGGVMRGSSLEVAQNVLQVSGDGIRIGTDGARIRNNEIIPLGEGTGNGIALVSGLDTSGIDHCQVFGNRILDIRGDGIAIRTRVNSAMIKHNFIDGVGRGAIVMEEAGSAGYLAVENNQILNVGTGFNDRGGLYTALRLVAVERADIADNLFYGVARDAVQASGRFGIQAAAVNDLVIKSNRLHGIGPVVEFVGTAAAILLFSPFTRVSIDGNTVTRATTEDEQLVQAQWQAVVVVAPSQTPLPLAPDLAFFTLDQQRSVLLSMTHLHFVAARRGTMAVQANNIDGTSSSRPVVQVDSVNTCLLTSNHCRQISDRGAPLVEIRNASVNASNNRLEGPGQLPTMDMSNTPPRLENDWFAVIGNLTSGEIFVQGEAIVGDPWGPLNIRVQSS